MKLVGTEIGRVVQLVVPDEVRPARGLDLPTFLQNVAARYGFMKSPASLEGFSQPAGAKFEFGRFSASSSSDVVAIQELSLFNDGVIATCADTDLSDALVDDFFAWTVALGLLREPISPRPRQYLSNVIVEFDKILPCRFERMFKTASRFNSVLNEHYGWNTQTSLARLAISADPQSLPQHRAAVLIIERRAAVPYEQNYFWSSAPLRKLSHLALLEAMETELAVDWSLPEACR
jgi:hypothetical protein